MKLVPDGWRWPRIVTHVLDNESKTETLGFGIFSGGAYGSLVRSFGAEFFLWCIVFSSILVGGKMVAKSMLEAMAMKLNGGKPAEAVKENPDATIPPAV